jgi:hypothetical protein
MMLFMGRKQTWTQIGVVAERLLKRIGCERQLAPIEQRSNEAADGIEKIGGHVGEGHDRRNQAGAEGFDSSRGKERGRRIVSAHNGGDLQLGPYSATAGSGRRDGNA